MEIGLSRAADTSLAGPPRGGGERAGREPRRGEVPVKAVGPLVSLVDDDESVRESLPDLLRELGYEVRAFRSAEEFLASGFLGRTRCLLLDVAMPGMTGPDLQLELARRRETIPIVFITAQADEAVRRSVVERGAVDCLFKPFTETALLHALTAALRVN